MKNYKSLIDHIKENELENIKVTDDSNAWIEYPKFNFIYNKLWLATSQDIPSGPMGIYPNKYPIVFKPIINLFGMSRGFKIIHNENEYNNNIKDGFFWEEYLEGDHHCIDIIINKGKIVFTSALQSYSDGNGGFLYHTSLPEYKLPYHLEFWLNMYFNEYTGCINLETINGLIIEGHLRLNGDFHIYNTTFVKSLDFFYKNEIWDLNYDIKKTYLIPIFVAKDFDINDTIKIMNKVIEVLEKENITSFYHDKIDSKCQSEWKSRLFMFEVKNFTLELLEKIKNL